MDPAHGSQSLRTDISVPGFPWPRFRREFADQYRDLCGSRPREWTTVKIDVRGDKARLYVHDAPQPTLLVNDFKQGQGKGAIALRSGLAAALPRRGRTLCSLAPGSYLT
jgi:hypothetical protein